MILGDGTVANETKLAVILHADVVGSTRLVQWDERLAHERMQSAFHRFSAIAADHRGTTHEVRGDALVAEFERASDATTAALAFQTENTALNESLDGEVRPVCRIGIALGEVIIADGTVTGEGVVLAQRLEQLAVPGGVCISAAIREAVPGRLGFGYADLGEHQLKGFDQPQRAYAVSPGEQTRPPTSVQAPLEGGMHSDKASIAVLPFENMSNDPEQDYFADGMAEDIISGLSKFAALRVIARNSTFAYKGQSPDLRDVSRELGVRYVLEGSIRKAGERIRVSAQLADTETHAQVWSERYDGALTDIFELQDEVTAAIVSAIAPEIDRIELQRTARYAPEDLDAWGLYHRGLALAYSGREADVLAGLRLFDDARKSDPTLVDATAMAAFLRLRFRTHFTDPKSEVYFQEAEELLNEVLRLNASHPMVLVVKGRYHMVVGEYDLAIHSLEKAIGDNPNLSIAYHELAFVCSLSGDYERALENTAIADKLNPRDPRQSARDAIRAAAYFHLGEHEECVKWATHSIRSQDPRPWAYGILVAGLLQLNRTEDVQNAMNRLRREYPDLSTSSFPADYLSGPFGSALIEAGLLES